MSQRRKMRRHGLTSASFGSGSGPSREDMQAMLWAQLLSPAEHAELRGDGDEACDAEKPPNCPTGVSCPFRKGHSCACRFFSDLEGGGFE